MAASDVSMEREAPGPPRGGLDSFFKLTERGTSIGTEVKAGLATFMVMSYILFLNPLILSSMFSDPVAADAFIPQAAAATALVAGLLSIAMGLVANYPIALAAGLGINGAVALGLVVGQGLTPAGAMGVIVLEGLVVTLLVVVGLREAVMNAVPLGLKRAIGVGIGLFILFIGLVDAGVIVNNPDALDPVPVLFVFPNSAALGVFFIGLLVTIVLFVRRIPGALILSILITTAVALIAQVEPFPTSLTSPFDFGTIGDFDVTNVFSTLGLVAALLTIFSFMLTDFFDTMGTATGIVEQAGLTDEEGRVPGIGRLLLVDSVGAVAGGAAGISSNTSYIESAAGVAEGGRTGLTAVVVGVLFLLAIFLSPLATLVPFAATGPVLVVVGYLMVTLIKDIDFGDIEEGFPALLTLILMPLTFKITVGIGAGFVSYVLIKVARGKIGEIHPLMWLVAAAFVIYFAQAVLPGGISA